jgi:putative acetyltransferase
MSYEIRQDDLTSREVQALILEHLSGMHQHSPAENVHALAIEGLRKPEITFWSAWRGAALCGCGALKELDERNGEVKSMRTRAAMLRQGVGQAVLEQILSTARWRGYRHLYLETGTGTAFEPAHKLYLRNGFQYCEAFAPYKPNDFSAFMVKPL